MHRMIITLLVLIGWGVASIVIMLAFSRQNLVERRVCLEVESNPSYNTASPPDDFTYVKEPFERNQSRDQGCDMVNEGAKWNMTIFVKSAAYNFRKRESFRRTWASVSYLDGLAIRTIFVVGKTELSKTNELLDDEFQRYGDILQYSGPDDYKHIANKTLAGMYWASKNLRSQHFYVSMDDDVMVDVRAMLQTLLTYNETKLRQDWPEFPIVCLYEKRRISKPLRDSKSKYYTSRDEYRWSRWPAFCLGGMYATSVSVMRQLYQVSKLVKSLSMDDVWVTGVLREKLGMPSDMVVGPSTPAARHYPGFNDQKTREEWQKIKAGLNESTVCFVDS